MLPMLWLALGLGVVGMVAVSVAVLVVVVLPKRSRAVEASEDLSDFAPVPSAPARELPPEGAAVSSAQDAEPPMVEAPAVEAPAIVAPVVEAPVVETPVVEAPVVEAPVVEAPVIAAPVVEAPVAEAPVFEAPLSRPANGPVFEAPLAVVLTRVEKIRLPDASVSVLAHALELDGVELLAFVTEGFAARGRPELVYYGPRAAFAEADVVRTLRRFAAMALLLFERAEPVAVGEVLKFAGELGAAPLAGYLALEPNEPAIVPVGEHLVLFGLQRRDLSDSPPALRAALIARHGGVPYVTTLAEERLLGPA